MRIPSNLTSLIDEGLIEEVVRPLMSGKEAEVFLLRAGGELRRSLMDKWAAFATTAPAKVLPLQTGQGNRE